MNYEARDQLNAASRAKVEEVAKLGQDKGLWTILPEPGRDANETWRFVRVATPNGCSYSIVGGGWGKEGRLTMSLGRVDGPNGLNVSPHDVLRYSQASPSATAAHTKPAEAILKDFQRRILDNPEARELAELVRDTLAKRVASQSTLRTHIETLKALGYEFRKEATETYSADGQYQWSSIRGGRPQSVRVYETGRVEFTATTDLKTFEAVLALLSAAA